mgnify:CR=1 FL=1
MPYGLRGLLGARLTLRTGSKDAHSGVTGGAARNPLAELMEVAQACVDAKSGKTLWQYDPKVPGAAGPKGCCDVVSRGIAYDDGRIFVATYDGRLAAVDEIELVAVRIRPGEKAELVRLVGAP